MKKTILGLDLGTNSIGWALVDKSTKIENDKIIELKEGTIQGLGSRIIPMSQDILGEFDKGNSVSQTASRTGYRGVRRLHERNLLRRERLQRVLNVLDFLPAHFAEKLDKYGKFIDGIEIKLPYSHYNETTKKWDFIFKNAYHEMLNDFKKNQPQLFFTKKNGEESKVPYDWTIYYLRKKALTEKIEKDELAWLLLHFNQKRGYYQLRGEDEVKNENKIEAFYNLKIVDVVETEKGKKDGEIWYNVILENRWIYRRASRIPLFDWKNKNRDFIVTTELNEDGSVKTDKDGKEKRSFRAPKDDDWNLLKKKTENDISVSKKYVGEFIYDTLLQQPNQKIKGKLVRTIERNFYKEELQKIISTQINFHAELQDKSNYKICCDALYENNESYKNSIANKDFNYLLVDDILFYQRPLKSKKSEISDCTLESRKYILNGETKTESLKCIAKSHPLFQEFRIWQWLSNVKIYERNQTADIDRTKDFLKSEIDYEMLFEFLNERKEIDQTAFLKFILKSKKLKPKDLNEMVLKYRWNYIDDNEKTYPCNKTRNYIINKIGKDKCAEFLTQEMEIKIWQALYSIKTKEEADKAFSKNEKRNQKKLKITDKNTLNGNSNLHYNLYEILSKNGISDDTILSLSKIKLDEKQYGSYSEKAIKKLLPLMRLGKYWKEADVISNMATYQKNIEAVIATINKRENSSSRVKEELLNLDADINAYKGLRKEIATYLVYQIHSEASDNSKWETANDLAWYMDNKNPNRFKQHSLRNPIVEQVITETLRVVKDIWVKYGEGKKDFFNEIHIELGREMKNNAEDRKAITENNLKNENTNLRIRAILAELQNLGVEKVMPHSPYQMEAFKIYEDFVLKSEKEIPEDVIKISKSSNPSSSDILRYKLWLEQKYKSPYTGATIPMSKLFTTAYEIEHIIPQSIYFDDSFSNKVICESEVNKNPYKDNQFGLEFIKNCGSQIVSLNGGATVKIFTEDEYRKFIEEHYANNKAKAKKLLLEEVPEKMIERQLNDTRYISKVVKNLLSKIVREENEEAVTSKNVIATNGTITSVLKQDWGLNDVWNELMLPRFERLNELSKTTNFTYYNDKHQKHLPTVPDELRQGFQLKRIDHRHHAMDAVVIACTTRNHINYLNNQTALEKGKKKNEKQKSREDLKKDLCFKTKPDVKGNYKWQFYKPWESITLDAKQKLETTIISFKQNIRVINKTVNKFYSFREENGNLRIGKNGLPQKGIIKQKKGENWAIRKPLHKETVYGKVQIKTDFGKTMSINNAIENWQLIINQEIKSIIKSKIKECNQDFALVKKYFKENPITIDGNKIDKINVNEWVHGTASRVALDDSFTEAKIKEQITDSAIQKILLNHLKNYENQVDDKGKPVPARLLAFSPEGIEEMNKNITTLNNGVKHQPIYKVRVYEAGNRFKVGYTGNKKDKYVEAAKGTNLYFAIYQDDSGKRSYDTIALNVVIERLKQKLEPVPEKENCKLLFWLSPNDLVYIPSNEEIENLSAIDFNNLSKEQVKRVYKFVDGGGTTANFVSQFVSSLIFECTNNEQQKLKINYCIQNEFGVGSPQSKNQKSIAGIMIKEHCIKLDVDRLGNIKINRY